MLALPLGAAVLAAGVRPAAATPYPWFWSEIPRRIEAHDASRNTRALAVIEDAQRRGRMRIVTEKRMAGLAKRWRDEIEAASRRARVSQALLLAVVLVESAGNPGAVSPAGAQGLAQLMPGTARRYGVRNSFDPAANLVGGARYLSDLLVLYEGDLVTSLAAYNAGEGAVARFGGVPPYGETLAYVPRVLNAFLSASQICRRPPRNARRQCRLPRLAR